MRLQALQEEVERGRQEILADRREIIETRPIVEAATRRTDASFIAVEAQTKLASLECALIRDLTEGMNGHG